MLTPQETPSRHFGEIDASLLNGSVIIRDVRIVKYDEQGWNVIMLFMCKCNCECE